MEQKRREEKERDRPGGSQRCGSYARYVKETEYIHSKRTSKRKRVKTARKKNSFYKSPTWRKLRYAAFKLYGAKCSLCNSVDKQLHVDHIKPRSIYPRLQYDLSNMQILCIDCNLGKSNSDDTDWRT